jgi:hypothetical protein
MEGGALSRVGWGDTGTSAARLRDIGNLAQIVRAVLARSFAKVSRLACALARFCSSSLANTAILSKRVRRPNIHAGRINNRSTFMQAASIMIAHGLCLRSDASLARRAAISADYVLLSGPADSRPSQDGSPRRFAKTVRQDGSPRRFAVQVLLNACGLWISGAEFMDVNLSRILPNRLSSFVGADRPRSVVQAGQRAEAVR